MKVSILAPDVSGNCMGRVLILADLLAAEHAVSIVGPQFGAGVWGPAGAVAHELRIVQGGPWPWFARAYRELIRSVDGDVILAVKPLPCSFGVALAVRQRTGRPVVLDIDDDEIAFVPRTLRTTAALYDLLSPNGGRATRRVAALVGSADAITVASSGLQREFGGTIVPHAKNTDRLRPAPEFAAAAKQELGLGTKPVVMFFGTPHPWKGLDTVVAAMSRLRHDAVLAIVGARDGNTYAMKLATRGDVRVFPEQPLARLPFLIQAADIMVVPQTADPRAARQLPSKLLDAMAAGRPVVASDVGDIGAILADGRGCVVPPADAGALATALDDLLGDPECAAAMGARARRWAEANVSYDAVGPRLRHVVAGAVRRSEDRGAATRVVPA